MVSKMADCLHFKRQVFITYDGWNMKVISFLTLDSLYGSFSVTLLSVRVMLNNAYDACNANTAHGGYKAIGGNDRRLS